jgi:hypothetical protein
VAHKLYRFVRVKLRVSVLCWNELKGVDKIPAMETARTRGPPRRLAAREGEARGPVVKLGLKEGENRGLIPASGDSQMW